MTRFHYICALLFLTTFLGLYSQTPKLTLPAISGRPSSATTLQNRQHLLIGSGDFGSIWEVSSGRMLLMQTPGWWKAVEAPDKRTVAMVRNHRVYFFDLERFRIVDSVRIDQIEDAAYAADGSLYAAINYRDKRVLALVDRQAKDKVDIFSTTDFKPGGNTVLSISPDGRYAILQPEKSPSHLVDLQSRSVVQSLQAPKSRFYFMPNGRVAEIEETADYQYVFKVLSVPSLREEFRFNGTTRSLPFIHGKNTFWLDDNRLMVCRDETSAVVDFGRRSVSADFKYHSTYLPASVNAPGRTSQGRVQTVFRIITHPSNRIEEWDIRTEPYRKIREIGASAIAPFELSTAPNDLRIRCAHEREVRLGRVPVFWRYQTLEKQSVYSPDGALAYHFGSFNHIEKLPTQTKGAKYTARVGAAYGYEKSVNSAAVDKKGNLGAFVSSDRIVLINLRDMSIAREVKFGGDPKTPKASHLVSFFDNRVVLK